MTVHEQGALDGIATLSAVLGFGAVGVVSTARLAFRYVRGMVRTKKDRTALGSSYATWRELAGPDGAGRFGPSLLQQIRAAERQLADLVEASLAASLDERLDGRASGTVGLTWRDVICGDELLLPTAFSDGQAAAIALHDFDPLDLVARRSDDGPYLITGPAGSGKSTLCLLVQQRCRDMRHAAWLIVLSIRDFTVDGRSRHLATGSQDWLVAAVASTLPGRTLSAFRERVLRDLLEARAKIVIDGFDEISAFLGPEPTSDLASSWVFRHAIMVTARSSFYEEAMAGHVEYRGFRVLDFQPASEAAIEAHIEVLARRMHGPAEGPVRAVEAVALRRATPGVRSTTRSPLLLTMFAAAAPSVRGGGDRLDSTLVYRRFVQSTLEREAARGTLAIPVQATERMLIELAWLLQRHPERRALGHSLLAETARGLVDPGGGSRTDAIRSLEMCPILMIQRNPRNPSTYAVSFYHASFEDYFVARRFEDWLVGDSDVGDDFFDVIETPGITFFVKEILLRASRSGPEVRSAMSLRLKEKLLSLMKMRSECSEEGIARQYSFAAGQTAYYLGLAGSVESQRWLERFAESEQDFWIRRAASIGLTFGGRPTQSHRLIDAMRRDIDEGMFDTARKNIAVELGFYGDQPFDPLDPTFDHGRPNCERYVARSTIELGLTVESANWRLILFNLLYLARWRPVSSDSFRRAFLDNAQNIRAALEALASDPRKSSYPEIMEMDALLFTHGY